MLSCRGPCWYDKKAIVALGSPSASHCAYMFSSAIFLCGDTTPLTQWARKGLRGGPGRRGGGGGGGSAAGLRSQDLHHIRFWTDTIGVPEPMREWIPSLCTVCMTCIIQCAGPIHLVHPDPCNNRYPAYEEEPRLV